MHLRSFSILAWLAAVTTTAHAGALVDVTPLGSQSAKSLDLTKIAIHAQVLLPSRNSISFYRLRYNTIAPSGSPVVASGLLILPNPTGPKRNQVSVISYQHGTTFSRTEAPSESTLYPETMAIAIAFGSMGYAVVAADYLGQGTSEMIHPYLYAPTEASEAADLLLAAQEYFLEQGITWTGQLDLVGYSEGAHATMALQRYLESRESRESGEGPSKLPPVEATVAGAGPYDLSGITLDAALSAQSSLWSASSADIIFSMNQIYGFETSLGDIFQSSYAPLIPELFSGLQTSEKVIQALPPRLSDLLQPAFYQAVQNNPAHPLRVALQKNDVYDWTPRAPILFLHARGDTRVPYQNSVKILQTMSDRGGHVTLENLGKKLDHDEAFIPAMIRAEQSIESLHPFSK
jgi:pimeloyl-ACP methyl ester carboxylesterase